MKLTPQRLLNLIYTSAQVLTLFGMVVPAVSGLILKIMLGTIPKTAYYWVMLLTTLKLSLFLNIALLVALISVIMYIEVKRNPE